MSVLIPWTILLVLAVVVARYIRHESSTRRKNETTLGEVLEVVTSLHSSLVASGVVERSARLPPPSPKVSPPSKPPGLPRKPVTVTKDDDSVHMRETKVQPAADALVDATKPDEPPSTKPITSTARPVAMDAQIGRAQERRWENRAAALRTQLGEPDSSEIRAKYNEEADEKDARDNAKEAELPLDATLASAQPPEAIPIAEAVGLDMTRVLDRKAMPTVRPPPPHRPPRPLKVGDPLANVPLERPVSSASRTAELGRRPTLFGGLNAPREPSWVEKHAAALVAQGVDPTTAWQRAKDEGVIANAAPGSARPPTPTPTEPGGERIDTRIERRWTQKVATAQEAGKDAHHCYGERCFQEGRDITLCDCSCPGCRLVVALHVQARRETAAEEDWGA